MIKKFLILFLLIIGTICVVGCSSGNEGEVKNAFNSYYDWFDSTFIENSEESKLEDNEENTEEDIEVIAPEPETSSKYSNFVLSKEKIIF